ncbi:septal ring lytic transglycosylase RlpA family protein [Flavobacterium wongokense]|uniref:septal ring lytic transglycosylase RlpA family protein n=1 Tax=Flavobacterium wongokense TaxID=2910674 RepID=UPI002105948D|nr:septal ring lytic transglycosylase RlpA family protein [Flavobacterium sp. WG47]
MNNKIFILLLALTTSVFGSSLLDKKPQQKDKNKDKSAKISETKDKEKAAVIVKVDTPKTTVAKLKTGLEIDTLNIAEFNFKFLKKNAHASYYHNKFNGRRTASGKRFDNNGYTAAHKKLPFGTFVKVTNEANGKFVIVEITDRGPFSKVREIDLSRRAFMDIASNKNSGMVLVTLEIIEPKK